MATSTTYFGNRGRIKLLNTWNAGTYTFTNGSTSFTGTGSAGQYVWKASDGVQAAALVSSPGVLAYGYKGTSGSGQPGYNSTPETLAVLRGLELNVSWETAELYGTDSVFRVDEAKHSVKVETKVKYCKWNPDPTVDWTSAVLKGTLTGMDGTVTDTNTVYLNGVVYTVIGSAGGTFEIVAGETYWQGFPIPFPENDFIIRDLTGMARNAIFNAY